MKKALILFGRSKWENKSPFLDCKYQHCYEYLYTLAKETGLDFYRASYQWYDEEKRTFKHAWTFRNGQWVKVNNINPDIIYDKARCRGELNYFKERIKKHFLIANDPGFTLLVNNKLYVSLLFPRFFKPYYLVNTEEKLQELANKINGDKIVIKPLNESGGKGVQIIDKSVISSVKIEKEMITQEFIDSSSGIKNIVSGHHDLRLVFINDTLIYSYVRQPKKGSLLANLAQGGKMFIIQERDLPASVFPIIKEVQKKLSTFCPRIFTIDLIFDKQQRPWIVELNSMPGMYFSSDQKEQMNKMYLSLVETLKNCFK